MNLTISQPSQVEYSGLKFMIDLDNEKVFMSYSDSTTPYTRKITEDEFNGLKAILRPIALEIPGSVSCTDSTYVGS